jgi:hypothetical protein
MLAVSEWFRITSSLYDFWGYSALKLCPSEVITCPTRLELNVDVAKDVSSMCGKEST